MKSPYCIYADFESINEKGKQTLCSYGYVCVRSDGKIYPPKLYTVKSQNDSCVEHFLKSLKRDEESLSKIIKDNSTMHKKCENGILKDLKKIIFKRFNES